MKTRAELYQFKHGNRTWYFTNQRKAIMHAGIEYLPVRGLQRTAIEDESIDNDLKMVDTTIREYYGIPKETIFLLYLLEKSSMAVSLSPFLSCI